MIKAYFLDLDNTEDLSILTVTIEPHLLSRNITLLIFKECSKSIFEHSLGIIVLTGQFPIYQNKIYFHT